MNKLPIKKAKTMVIDPTLSISSTSRTIPSNLNVTKISRIGYDISFTNRSKNPVIQSELLEGENFQIHNCEVNTLCKIPHTTIDRKETKYDLEVYIQSIINKMLGINGEISTKKHDKDKMSEENLRMVFSNENAVDSRKAVEAEIRQLKEEIAKMRELLNQTTTQTTKMELEVIEEKNEIVSLQEQTKKVELKVKKQMKDVAAIRSKLIAQQNKIEQIKKQMGMEYGNVDKDFVKDIIKLIPNKKKKKLF